MRNVYLAQIPYQFENTKVIVFPYSVGLLWSYAQTRSIIENNYDLKNIFFIREPIENIIKNIVDPDIIGLSCYNWNINFNLELAKEIKKRWPDCLIIVGGPQIAEDDQTLFEKNKFLDVAIYHEGEITFADILEARHKGKSFDLIPGISFIKNGQTYRTSSPIRTNDLDQIPSPYLNGIFYQVMQEASSRGLELNFMQETNRGCPYQCTFCDWGNGVLGKVKKFDLRRVKKELLWAAKNKIGFINNCDANFGIFKERDYAIAKFIVKLKKRYGYPQLFDTNWLKNSDNHAINTAKLLLDNGLLRRFSASTQTKNAESLKAIKRINLKDEELAKIISLARQNNIIVSTDLIIGLPMETYDSLRQSFVETIESDLYPTTSFLTILQGSEMNDPDYREKYGIKTLWNKNRLPYVDEWDEIVIGTNTMSSEEMQKIILWIWFIQQFHCHGYTNVICDFFIRHKSYTLDKFYDMLMDLSLQTSGTWLHNIISPYKNHIYDGLTAQLEIGMNNSNLHAQIAFSNREEFYSDLTYMIADLIDDKKLLKDIIKLQDYNQYSPYRNQDSKFTLDTNLFDYLYGKADLELESINAYKCHQIGKIPNDDTFGYHFVVTRYSKGWKNIITNCKFNNK